MDGLGAEDVRADVEGLEVKRKKADEVQKKMLDFEKKMQEEKIKTDMMLNMVEEVEESMNRAYERAWVHRVLLRKEETGVA